MRLLCQVELRKCSCQQTRRMEDERFDHSRPLSISSHRITTKLALPSLNKIDSGIIVRQTGGTQQPRNASLPLKSGPLYPKFTVPGAILAGTKWSPPYHMVALEVRGSADGVYHDLPLGLSDTQITHISKRSITLVIVFRCFPITMILEQTQTLALAVLTITACVALGWCAQITAVRKRRNPPGPPSKPLIGNIMSIGVPSAWIKFTEYKEKYGA